jgi:pimeloyl-ACP methyl ester carboxylesterase
MSNHSLIETHDGTRLFYQDWGTGKPVVFVHGWGLGADMWEYQTIALSVGVASLEENRGLRCIAYDKRGCGRSERSSFGYDFDTFADDLAALIEQLELEDVTLVGFSAGGGDVARYLSRHGTERISKTILIGTITPFIRLIGRQLELHLYHDKILGYLGNHLVVELPRIRVTEPDKRRGRCRFFRAFGESGRSEDSGEKVRLSVT